MLTAYLIALSFGAVLLGANLLLGGGDHDADHGLDGGPELDAGPHFDAQDGIDVGSAAVEQLEADHGGSDTPSVAGDAAQGILFNPLFSIRFWTYFSASFGGIGSLLHFVNVAPSIHIPASLFVGGVTGYTVAAVFRVLSRSTVTSETSSNSMVGSEARVLLAIPRDGTGKVRIRSGGQDYDLLATSNSSERIEREDTVLVVAVRNGVARVESLPSSREVPERRSALFSSSKSSSSSRAIAAPTKKES
jgi:membrane protein implicated in regulation of membrane protease activity